MTDRMISAERSYRATLLGQRHGLDLVRSLRQVALAADDASLAMFCDGWIAQRTPLVEAVAARLSWFAANPDRAMASAREGVGEPSSGSRQGLRARTAETT